MKCFGTNLYNYQKMRKFYSFIIAALAVIAAASCNKELQDVPQRSEGEVMTFTAYTDGADTKTVLDGKLSKWVSGDAITVLNSRGGCRFTTTDEGARATFINTASPLMGDGFMAVYPAEYADHKYVADPAEKTVKAHIPTWQQAVAGTYSSTAAVAVAYTEKEEASLQFKNAVALLKFRVKNDNVSHVTFFSNAGEAISGDVEVALNEDNTLKSVTCLETPVTENVDGVETTENKFMTYTELYAYQDDEHLFFTVGEDYYIAVAPQTFSQGYGIEFSFDGNKDAKFKVKEYTKGSVTLQANVIYDLGELEYEVEVPETVSTVYMKPCVWDVDEAWFSAHFWGASGEADVRMTDADNDGIWEAAVPEGMTDVLFCRMNPEYQEFGWDVKEGEGEEEVVLEDHVWNQSADLIVPADDVNCYVIKDWESAEWMTLDAAADYEYVPVDPAPDPDVVWAIAGSFNDWSLTADPMTLEDGFYVAKNITGLHYTQPEGEETGSATGFKFIENGTVWKGGEGKVVEGVWAWIWEDNGGNIYVDGATESSSYDIYLNPETRKFVVVESGSSMPEDKPAEIPETAAWGICGSFTDWSSDVAMQQEGNCYIAEDVEIPAGSEFKFRVGGNWQSGELTYAGVVESGKEYTVSSSGGNISVVESGVYDVYLWPSDKKMKIEKVGDLAGEEPDAEGTWSMTGSFAGWDQTVTAYTMSTEGKWFVYRNFTLASDSEVKFVENYSWDTNRGGRWNGVNNPTGVSQNGMNIAVPAGSYDVYMNGSKTLVYFMTPGTAPKN